MIKPVTVLYAVAETTAIYLALCLVARMFDRPVTPYEMAAPFTPWHPWLLTFTVAVSVVVYLRPHR